MEQLQYIQEFTTPILEEIKPLAGTYAHLIFASIFPIYTSARAGLHRPSSAAPKPDPSKDGSSTDDEQDNDDDEDEAESRMPRMEGMSPSDAIIFPLLAGCTLTGLYLLIKWLGNADILNLILGWYFSFFAIFSVTQFLSDSLRTITSFIFPRSYLTGGAVYSVDTKTRSVRDGRGNVTETTSPLPGVLSKIPIPAFIQKDLWKVLNLLNTKLSVRVVVRPLISGEFRLSSIHLVSFLGAIAISISSNLGPKPWWLTNLMGFSFSYGALQLMSPTTFSTGTMLLSALFFYDIYMVFKTPMMVTVAKSLDIPIKLVFPRPAPPGAKNPLETHHAMLGLGDVVIPGLIMGLAIRFDHYMFYLRKQNEVTTVAEDGTESVEVVKARYIVPSAMPQKFWLSSWKELLLPFGNKTIKTIHTFPKPYFRASLVGYFIGIVSTLFSMHAMKHAQPALLYLVPGVLISVWATGLVRGELKEMWMYSEAVGEDDGDDPSSTTKAKAESPDDKSMFSSSKMKTNEAAFTSAISQWFKPTATSEPMEGTAVDDGTSRKQDDSACSKTTDEAVNPSELDSAGDGFKSTSCFHLSIRVAQPKARTRHSVDLAVKDKKGV